MNEGRGKKDKKNLAHVLCTINILIRFIRIDAMDTPIAELWWTIVRG